MDHIKKYHNSFAIVDDDDIYRCLNDDSDDESDVDGTASCAASDWISSYGSKNNGDTDDDDDDDFPAISFHTKSIPRRCATNLLSHNSNQLAQTAAGCQQQQENQDDESIKIDSLRGNKAWNRNDGEEEEDEDDGASSFALPDKQQMGCSFAVGVEDDGHYHDLFSDDDESTIASWHTKSVPHHASFFREDFSYEETGSPGEPLHGDDDDPYARCEEVRKQPQQRYHHQGGQDIQLLVEQIRHMEWQKQEVFRIAHHLCTELTTENRGMNKKNELKGKLGKANFADVTPSPHCPPPPIKELIIPVGYVDDVSVVLSLEDSFCR